MTLAKEKLERYRKQLVEMKEHILKELEKAEKIDTFGGEAGDENEQADEVEELGAQIAIVDVRKADLEEVLTALKKMEDGTYGKCERCGAEISEMVLNIAPESSFCEKCKKSKS